MMRKLLKKNPLFFLPTFAYVLFNFKAFYRSELFDPKLFTFFLVPFLLLDLIFLKIKSKDNCYLEKSIKTIYALLIIFWFGLTFTHHIHIATKELINNPHFKPRIWFALFFILTLTTEYFILSKKHGVYFQNIFWSILCTVLFYDLIEFNSRYEQNLILSQKPKTINKHNGKTTLLIISDEYISPIELQKIDKRPNNELISYLDNNGWIIKKDFASREVSSIHSFSSMLNFNLSSKQGFSNVPVWQVGLNFLIKKPALIDHLEKQNIPIINLGIFHMGSHNPVNRLYFYPTNFSELILSNSSFFPIWDYIKRKEFSRIALSHHLTDEQNQFILDSLPLITKKNRENKAFIYAHLFMPHPPYSFKGHLFKNTTPLLTYIDYWHFTNKKIIELLNQVEPGPNIRIILTGDHGLRASEVDPTKTFAAFWGFDKADVDQVQTVQDLGSLINGYY